MEHRNLVDVDELIKKLEEIKGGHKYGSSGSEDKRVGFWDPWGENRDLKDIIREKDQQILTLTSQYKASVELCTNLQAQVNTLLSQLRECQTKH